MKLSKNRRPVTAARTRIVAADEDEFNITDTIDDISDSVDDIQEVVDDIEEDDVDIELDNNIDNHFIAECDSCHGIFISALAQSDQEVESISGVCPLCGKETEQYLKWIIKNVRDIEDSM